MTPQPDPELIAQAKRGDKNAFRKLVETYQGFLYSVAFIYMGNQAEAEDAVQETFIKLWKNLLKYKDEAKLSTWLYRILVNHCLDLKKSSFNRHKLSVSMESANEYSGRDTPHTELIGKELADILQQAINQLVGKQKMIFVLRDMEGLDTTEVCGLMNMDETQVKSNLYYARQSVKDWIKRQYT